jgi:hypothetical protein
MDNMVWLEAIVYKDGAYRPPSVYDPLQKYIMVIADLAPFAEGKVRDDALRWVEEASVLNNLLSYRGC